MPDAPLEFQFSLEPGMSESEIEKLWLDAQTAQNALDRFLAGEYTEHELTDLLAKCDVDIDETRETLDQNAQFLGLSPIY
jgi:hypothetical protein